MEEFGQTPQPDGRALQEDVGSASRSTATEKGIIENIFDGGEVELIRLHQELWSARETFKKLVTEFVGAQHNIDVVGSLL